MFNGRLLIKNFLKRKKGCPFLFPISCRVGKRAARYFFWATFLPPACPPTIITYIYLFINILHGGQAGDENLANNRYRAARLPTLH
ncbi:hypothetical protein BGP_2728 [Beggiatoa sp. PS]|nr:hypothetical protein BGP_2728 [Beggiatoa sp. PS]